MHVKCPHCRNPIEVVDDVEFDEVNCPSCGSSFALIDQEETKTLRLPKEKTVGHFVLEQKLGTGAFGSVWKATDVELDRTVAVKIPRQADLNSDEAWRFVREARAAAQLRHPNIVSVHEVGRDDGCLFIVSDFVDGVTLADWLTAHRPDFNEAVEICIKIADSLHHAHENGVIHRDLKPGNIMLNQAGEPFVMDFGLAKRDAGEITMTIHGEILGTPAYMSPEQAQGTSHDADRRTDVYSLGTILFELLTGERVFRGNTRMLIHQVVHEEAPSPRSLDASIPKDLETITLKCLEKDPDKRYASSAFFSNDLQRWSRGEPIHARPIGTISKTLKWCKRNPVPSFLLVATLGVAILAVAMTIREVRFRDLRISDRVSSLVEQLSTARVPETGLIVDELSQYPARSTDLLIRRLKTAKEEANLDQEIRARYALFKSDHQGANEFLRTTVNSHDLDWIVELVSAIGPQTDIKFLTPVEPNLIDSRHDEKVQFNRLCVWANVDSESLEFWTESRVDFLAQQMVSIWKEDPGNLSTALRLLEPLEDRIFPSLVEMYQNSTGALEKASYSTTLYSYSIGKPFRIAECISIMDVTDIEPFVRLANDSDPQEIQRLLQIKIASLDNSPTDFKSQNTNSILALIHLDARTDVRRFFLPSETPDFCETIISNLRKAKVPAETLLRWFQAEKDPAIRRTLIRSIGQFTADDMDKELRDRISDELAASYVDQDAKTLATIEFALKRLERLSRARKKKHSDFSSRRDWIQTKSGFRMVFLNLENDSNTQSNTYRFSIASKETTVQQYNRQFLLSLARNFVGDMKRYYPTPSCPQIGVSWNEAAGYCNWLSKQEGIPEEEWCFKKTEDGFATVENFLQKTGYRLPTEAEWEFACSGGASTSRFFGDIKSLADGYAWHTENCQNRTWPGGMLMPNQYGLFDMYGNVCEWCMDLGRNSKPGREYRVVKGGSFANGANLCTTKWRIEYLPFEKSINHGIRIARTVLQEEITD